MNEATSLEGNGRKYRSKKQRPCDLCRTRKIHCKLQADGADCELCRRLEKRCTFVLGPLRRKHRARDANDNEAPRRRRESQSQFERPDFGDIPPGVHAAEADRTERMNMDLGDGDLWALPADMRHPFAIQDMSSIMGYYGLGSNGGAFAASNGTSGAGGDGINMMLTEPSVDLSLDPSFLPAVLSPTNSNMAHPTRQGTSPPSTSSGSPSDTNSFSDQLRIQPPLQPDDEFTRRAGTAQQVTAHTHGSQSSLWPIELSLEAKKGYSNHLIGLSCESDPFLLKQYKYNAYDNYHMFRLDFRRVADDVQPRSNHDMPGSRAQLLTTRVPTQFMMSDEAIWKEDLKATERYLSGGGTGAADQALLNKIVEPELGRNLVKLYSRFVHPRYPVLSFTDLGRMLDHDTALHVPVGIRSAVYALAAPFTFLDDELSVSNGYLGVPTDDLWDIAHRSFQRDSCFSHLSLLQLCLLMLHMPPRNFVVAEPSKFWALSCSAVAIAENLGVNVEPKDWRLPREEVILRRRLWWLTYVGHTWHALVCGRPSHLHESNWSVSDLTEDDFEPGPDDPIIREAVAKHIPICLAQCELGVIAADVLKEFYSVRANYTESLALAALLSKAQRLRTRIESWRQTLPFLSKSVLELDEQEFENGAPLRLQHLTLEILIFRALLRPLSNEQVSTSDKCREPISTIYENCHVCASIHVTSYATFRR
ncbi:fungal specific transcription factor domain protein [Cordyceps fumosorosea ARSEF 2679]|uniref:Fungal specific transcription factor domain protein n=1 Tax=Cordyceps fumosorosea (strain ARSEF 2679) TaxID=1081104 RepID=A0A167SYZ4_CORFA|nr:fungal specific transcription factor domain protein [Cordyceps fumosorosea ARSEF 2679]OAA60075.1 fungal specific transcription factor domain protein [Cordyceps fumosorosea ARSEF 2679]